MGKQRMPLPPKKIYIEWKKKEENLAESLVTMMFKIDSSSKLSKRLILLLNENSSGTEKLIL